MTEKIEFLKTLPLFSNIDERTFEWIETSFSERTYKQGSVVIWEEDESKEMFIVCDGWLKVVKTSEIGREMILNLLKSGDTFNAMSAFNKFYNPATVIALEESHLMSIQYEDMSDLLDQHPQLARTLLQNFAARLQKMTAMVGNLSLQPVDVRLADLLITGATDDVFKRRKWLTQKEMASLIGTVPEVANRLLNDFVEEGIIEMNRHQIRIVNHDLLKKKANLV